MADLIECPTCKKLISSNAAACPNCGEPLFRSQKKSKLRYVFLAFGLLFVFSGIIVIIKGFEMVSLGRQDSIPASYTTPAAVLLCVGLFCAVAPFCQKK